jgi:hypothetical protein
MHLLSSPSVRIHNCGIFDQISGWLLNGMLADAVDANPMVKIECLIFAQHLPAASKKDTDKDFELLMSTSQYATGCQVMEIEPLSGPNRGREKSFTEMGLFWQPAYLAIPVDYSKTPDILGRVGLFAALNSNSSYPPLIETVSGAPLSGDVSAASSSGAVGAGVVASSSSSSSSSSTSVGPTTPLAPAAHVAGDLTEAQKKQVSNGHDLYARHSGSFKLQSIVGFYYPKFRVEALQDTWRAAGFLGSRPLHQLTAAVHSDLTLPEGLGFYIAPSNCPTYYANHFNKLADGPNAEFTDHWGMQDSECIPMLTFSLMATRKLKDGEQIFVDYGPTYADLEPHAFVTSVVASPEDENGETTEDKDNEGDSPAHLTKAPTTPRMLVMTLPAHGAGKKNPSAKRKLNDTPETPASSGAGKKNRKNPKARKKPSLAPDQSSGPMPATP